ncbi:MAG: translation initiation factor IF-2 [bacterium]|nr:translation initiation factor IF-2 [bacterium]
MTKEVTPTERPPVVAVLGHVDHGKSTLLDFIRKSNTVAGEAGGITQSVAAYEVVHSDGKRITFIDTPGHAAFQAIRARGASVADIGVLVVAADDGVKAQTLEALESIKSAGIPFVVAINKIDKTGASVERTQSSLMEKGVYLEKLGGDVPWTAVSAKTGEGVEELLNLILLVAELEGMKGDPSAPAKGYVVEAHRDKRRGIEATLIIKDGTLKSGMAVLAGRSVAPVRIMEDFTGKQLKESSFSTPVSLIGFDELPEAGAEFCSYANKRAAEKARPDVVALSNAPYAADFSGEVFLMPIIVRADSTGSLEALEHEIAQMGDEHARVHIVQSGIGVITEGDVKTAVSGATKATIIGFNVGVDAISDTLARQQGVRVECFDIIYKLTERLEELLVEARPTRVVEEVVGRARVVRQFSTRKGTHVVGGKVTEGYLAKKAKVRVLRRKSVVGEGEIENIQTNKQNVDRVDAPGEFGAQIGSVFEVAEGDTLECVVSTTL